jgi:hypothetical protein
MIFIQINHREKHSASHIKTQVAHVRARILHRLCKVNFADLQNTRCTIVQYNRIVLISHNTDYTGNLWLCLCLAQCRARRAAWLCRKPPRLAPLPPPIIIIHSHTEKFVLYISRGCAVLPVVTRLLPTAPLRGPTPAPRCFCSNTTVIFLKNNCGASHGWSAFSKENVS